MIKSSPQKNVMVVPWKPLVCFVSILLMCVLMVQGQQAFYEYYVPLKLPDQVYTANDWERLLNFYGFYDNTLVEMDVDKNGTFDVSFTLSKGEMVRVGRGNRGIYGITDFNLGTYIRTDKPVALRYHHANNDFGCYDDLIANFVILPTSLWGEKFALPFTGLGVNAIAANNSTTIWVDEDWDGIYENTFTLDAGDVIEMGSIPEGSYIESNNPIYVVAYNYSPNKESFWTYEVLPFSLQGKEYLTTEAGQSYSKISIIGISDESIVSVDSNNDGIYDLVQTLNKGEVLKVSNFTAATRIVSNQKICAAFKEDHFELGRHFTWAYSLFPIDNSKISYFTSFEFGVIPCRINQGFITSIEDNNFITIDQYDDESVEYTNTLNSRGTWVVTCPEPTYIVSSKPILISSYNNTTGFSPETTEGHMHYPTAFGFYELLQIESSIDIDPNTLNKKSKGKWITAYMDLPEGYDVNDIDISTVRLEYDSQTLTAQRGDVQDNLFMVKFSRPALINMLGDFTGYVELKVRGKVDNTPFEGTDTIRVK